MKKKIALILAACLLLSGCSTSSDIDKEDNDRYYDSDEENSDKTSRKDKDSKDEDKDGNILDDLFNNDEPAKPDVPEIPDVEPISADKLTYEFILNGECGSGMKITGVSSAAEAICFPDTIDGEPVVYIADDLEYSENVKTLIIPASIKDFGTIPRTIENIKLLDGRTEISEYMFAKGRARESIFEDECNLKFVSIPDSVTVIDYGAFDNCSSLTSVTIPDSVTTIGASAFRDCDSLTSVTIGNSVTTIGYRAFNNTPWLRNNTDEFVIVGDGVLLDYNGDGGDVVIPDGVTTIGDSAFSSCDSLTSATYKGKTYSYENIDDLYKAINGN